MQLKISLLLLSLLSVSSVIADNAILISNAWINAAPPTVQVVAAYMNIRNNSDEQIDLISARSPLFERIEFHFTRIENGVAKMQKQDNIPIAARSEFSFSPGEFHLMLFNNRKPLKAGDMVPLQFTFSDGQTVTINAEVKSANIATEHHH
ncbi:MAG: copper chaperone PCu(A)C [Gammaproteobacteria bacterium]|nr:copper chaperone PCu(A)C [Gammaproteobacteria bacterium]